MFDNHRIALRGIFVLEKEVSFHRSRETTWQPAGGLTGHRQRDFKARKPNEVRVR